MLLRGTTFLCSSTPDSSRRLVFSLGLQLACWTFSNFCQFVFDMVSVSRALYFSLSLFFLFIVHLFCAGYRTPSYRLAKFLLTFCLVYFRARFNFCLYHTATFCLPPTPNNRFLLLLTSNNFLLVSTSTSNLRFTFNINFCLCPTTIFALDTAN